jgi:hypothetical protein
MRGISAENGFWLGLMRLPLERVYRSMARHWVMADRTRLDFTFVELIGLRVRRRVLARLNSLEDDGSGLLNHG